MLVSIQMSLKSTDIPLHPKLHLDYRETSLMQWGKEIFLYSSQVENCQICLNMLVSFCLEVLIVCPHCSYICIGTSININNRYSCLRAKKIPWKNPKNPFSFWGCGTPQRWLGNPKRPPLALTFHSSWIDLVCIWSRSDRKWTKWRLFEVASILSHCVLYVWKPPELVGQKDTEWQRRGESLTDINSRFSSRTDKSQTPTMPRKWNLPGSSIQLFEVEPHGPGYIMKLIFVHLWRAEQKKLARRQATMKRR